MPEFTPQQIADYRVQKEIDEIIEHNRNTYQERVAEAQKPITAIFKPKLKKDPRGSRPGVKRGPYKRVAKSSTKLATSKYYSE